MILVFGRGFIGLNLKRKYNKLQGSFWQYISKMRNHELENIILDYRYFIIENTSLHNANSRNSCLF